jgi:sugar lactone lactonase YvrE
VRVLHIRIFLAGALVLTFVACRNGARPRYVLVAGGKGAGYSGDGGPAVEAALNSPGGIACDASGNLFIADSDNRAVRKVDTHGTITTIARNGAFGYHNSKIHAETGKQGPYEIACGADGSVYMSDGLYNRVCVVERTGQVRVVAGSGMAGYGGDGRPAARAKLNDPRGLFVCKNGDLLIADRGNYRVRRVDRAGIITTIAGNGTSGMTNVHRDALGHVSGDPPDEKHNGDGGPARSAFVEPWHVAADSRGNILVSEGVRVRKINPDGQMSTVAGGGPGTITVGARARDVSLGLLGGMTVDRDGNLLVVAAPSGPVYRITADGLICVWAANPTGPIVGPSAFRLPRGNSSIQPLVCLTGLALDSKNRLYISDSGSGVILRVVR